MRVLHLIDPGTPGGGACTLRLLAEPLARLTSVEQEVLVVGTRAHAALARRCGVEPAGTLSGPRALPVAGRAGLRRYLAEYARAGIRYDLIHAWSLRAAALAMVAAPRTKRLATFSVGPVTDFQTEFFRRLLRRYPMPILALSTAVEREYRSLGVDASLLSVHPPAVNTASVDPVDRDMLRERWEVGPDTFVLGSLSEPVSWADARTAIEVAARVGLSGRDVRLLVHQTAGRRVDAERWLRQLGNPEILIVDDDVAEPWRVAAGLDAALLIGGELNSIDLSVAGSPLAMLTGGGRRLRPMPGVQPLLWAMAAGVPVIAEESDAVRDVIEDGVNGLLVHQGDCLATCDRVRRLYDDRTIASRLGLAARKTLDERFHVSAFCVRLKEAYERVLAGRPVKIQSDLSDEAIIEERTHDLEWVRR